VARSTSSVQRVYDRVARVYDFMEAPMERMGGAARRRRVLSGARGRVLEVGVGTGAGLQHYPPGIELHGVDVSGPMLRRARERAVRDGVDMTLLQGDAERLPFGDATFDTATATCVFCSVADPVRGLRELGRVVRADGRILLLEHVRPENPVLGKLFDVLTPLTRRLVGPEINRRTEENVRLAGLDIVHVRRDGIWREIEARPTVAGLSRAGAVPPPAA
jgi:ubiquinone/menaquinone biosynthesis C-methylase UbiE